jgi:hypothetical protein
VINRGKKGLMNKEQKHRMSISLFSVLIAILLGSLMFVVNFPRIGYCFDAVFDESGEQLYVTAGYRGLHVFDITPRGEVSYLTTYCADGYYRYLEIADDRVYIANSKVGLEIVDIGKDEPRPKWKQGGFQVYGIHIMGDRAYLAANKSGLLIFDIVNPEAPIQIGGLSTDGRAWDVWVSEKHAFVADNSLGLIIVDVSTPSRPQQISSLTWGQESEAEVIDGRGEYVYIAAGKNGLIVVDVTDPSKPTSTFQYDPGTDSHGEGVVVQGEYLYLTMNDALSREQNGLHIFDIKEPSRPRLLSKFPLTDGVENISLSGTKLVVSNTRSGVVLFDVQDPSDPKIKGMYPGRFWRFFTQYLR